MKERIRPPEKLGKLQLHQVEKVINDLFVAYIDQLTDSFLMRIKETIDRELESRLGSNSRGGNQ